MRQEPLGPWSHSQETSAQRVKCSGDKAGVGTGEFDLRGCVLMNAHPLLSILFKKKKTFSNKLNQFSKRLGLRFVLFLRKVIC